MLLAWLFLMIIGLAILGLLWCAVWERETFIEWFPIVGHLDVFVDNIKDEVADYGFFGDILSFLAYVAVIIIPVVLIFFGFALVTDGTSNILPLPFEVAGGALAVIGWNQNGSLEMILYVIAAILVLIGCFISMKGGLFYGLFGTILLLGGLFLLPAALANFGLLLMIAIGIAVVIGAIYLFYLLITS